VNPVLAKGEWPVVSLSLCVLLSLTPGDGWEIGVGPGGDAGESVKTVRQ
jgi:hypothetical protein